MTLCQKVMRRNIDTILILAYLIFLAKVWLNNIDFLCNIYLLISSPTSSTVEINFYGA